MGGFFIRKDGTSAPSLFISIGNRGSSLISPVAIPISKTSAAPPFFPKLKESSAPPHIATGTTNTVDLSHHLRHGSESREGEGREICEVGVATGEMGELPLFPLLIKREGADVSSFRIKKPPTISPTTPHSTRAVREGTVDTESDTA